MKNFKVGDKVYTNDWCYGRIVEIKNNLAYVEFRSANGGGCLPFSFDELEHEKWCIITKDIVGNDIVYLGWQNPAWDEDGYFWTSKEIIEKIIDKNNTKEHPFIFNSRIAAIKHLKTLQIPQKCRIVRW